MKKKMLAAITALLACAAPVAHAASDYLLELDGIKGESSDAVHKDAIHIESFSWGASNPSAGTGGGAGKVSFSDLHFVTSASKASPQLLMACAAGRPIPSAKLMIRKPGETEVILTYELKDVYITSYSVSGSGASGVAGSAPSDVIRISFSRVEMSHTSEDGTVTRGTAALTIDPQ